MSWRARDREVGVRTGKREFERVPPRLRLALFRRERLPLRLRAVRLGLLKLDVFALEPSCHQ